MRKGTEGSAMILVMCVMMVVVVLAMSLLLSASTLISTANRSGAQEQCTIMAASLSQKLEMSFVDRPYAEIPNGEDIPEEQGTLFAYLGKYVAEDEGDWPSFEGDINESNARVFGAKWPQGTEIPGEASIRLYYEAEDTENSETPEESFRNKEIRLYVEVTCTIRGEVCTITNRYHKVQSTEDIDDVTWFWSRHKELEE